MSSRANKLFLVAAFFLLVGCGGVDTPETSDSEKSPSPIDEFIEKNATWVEEFNGYYGTLRFPFLGEKRFEFRTKPIDEAALAKMPLPYQNFLRELHVEVNELILVLEKQRSFENTAAWRFILNPSTLAMVSEKKAYPREFDTYQLRLKATETALIEFMNWYPEHVRSSDMDEVVKANALDIWRSLNEEKQEDDEWRLATLTRHFEMLNRGLDSYIDVFEFAKSHKLGFVAGERQTGVFNLQVVTTEVQTFENAQIESEFKKLAQQFRNEAEKESDSAAQMVSATIGWFPSLAKSN